MKKNIKQTIETSLITAVKELGLDAQKIEVDSKPSQGDYSSNVALSLFSQTEKGIWKSPRELAAAITEKLADVLPPDYAACVAGPGFINISLSSNFLLSQLVRLSEDPLALLHIVSPDKVIVEYSSPNIAKPFTVGHLRPTIIGDTVANILEIAGYTVYRDNHLGDWGTQFGKLIAAIKKWPEDFKQIESAPQPVKILVDLYIKFHSEAENDPSLEDEARAWFKKLEDGNTEARALWQQCIDWSWKEFSRIYQELGINLSLFENDGKGYGESYFEDKMGPVLSQLREKSLLSEGKDGAQLVFFPNDELPPLMILKKDGATLYATRDLATDLFRQEQYGKDITVINCVGIEQSLYFQQLFKTEELLGWYTKKQRVHIGNGHYRFKEGKMSTRKGNVVWLQDVITESQKRAESLAKESGSSKTTHQVGIGALKWNDLKRSAHLDVVFDWDEVLSMQGNSGPYVQYTAVRCASVLQKSTSLSTDLGLYQPNTQEMDVMRKLVKFADIIDEAAREYAPHYVCTYLYELASLFNTFYNKHKILDEEDATPYRLLLTRVVGATLTRGLALLGIETPEKM